MNPTHHKSSGRLADLSPFFIKVGVETPKPVPRVRYAVCRERLPGATETEEVYGCVDWYQYPDARGGIATAARASTSSGAQVLKRRIADAPKAVCKEIETAYPNRRPTTGDPPCEKGAIDAAMVQANATIAAAEKAHNK
jgi:hypothetical protein